MATTYTENFKFGKQEEKSDKFSMDVINQNMDDIDKYLGQAAVKLDKTADTDTAAQSEAAVNRSTLGYQGKNLCSINAVTLTAASGGFAIGTNPAPQKINVQSGKLIVSWKGTATTGQSEIRFIDSDKTTIITQKTIDNTETVNFEIDLPSNATYMTLYCSKANEMTEIMLRYAEITDDTYEPYVKSVDARLTAVENSVEITKPTLTVNSTYIASSRLYCHKVGKLVFVQGTITTVAEVPAWTTGLISGLPTISQAYYFRIVRTGTTASTPTIYLNSGGTTINVENNALAAEATYYLNFCYIEY